MKQSIALEVGRQDCEGKKWNILNLGITHILEHPLDFHLHDARLRDVARWGRDRGHSREGSTSSESIEDPKC